MALAIVNNIVKWNPFSCSFVAYDSKLKLYDVVSNSDGSREAVLSRFMNVSGEITTLDWYQHISVPKALAFGTAVASVYFLNWSKGQPEYVALRQARKSRQQCTEVVWNKWMVNQVAAGFDKSKKENCAVVYDLENGGPADLKANGDFPTSASFSADTVVSLCWLRPDLLAAGGDRGIVTLYDMRQSNDIPPKIVIAHANTSSRLSKKVKGIRSSPFDENIFATYSDLTGEPVKIWDMRKIERSKDSPVFSIFPHDPLPSPTSTAGTESNRTLQEKAAASQSIVTAVEFSKARHNVIAIGTSQKECVSLYCIKNSATELTSRTPLSTIHSPGGVKYLSWQGDSPSHHSDSTSTAHSSHSIVSSLFSSQKEQKEHRPQVFSGAGLAATQFSSSAAATHSRGESSIGEEIRSLFNNSTNSGRIECEVTKNRLLIATATQTMDFIDVIVCENQPLAVGALDTIIFGQGKSLSISQSSDLSFSNSPIKQLNQSPSPHNRSSPASTALIRHNSHPMNQWLDIDETMKNRCLCGYSIDSGKNIQALHDELDAIDSSSHHYEVTMQLLRAWNWVYRVELLHSTDFALNLSNCGILQLLLKDSQKNELKPSNDEVSIIHPVLGCEVFVSYRRSVGRLLCGWAALYSISDNTSSNRSIPEEHSEAQDLHTVVKDFEVLEHFERAAALALWHGNIVLAVKVLQRTIKANKATMNKQHEYDEENEGEPFIDELTSGLISQYLQSDQFFISLSDYIQLLSLVAMCFAGYGNQNNNRHKKLEKRFSDDSLPDDYDLSEKESDSHVDSHRDDNHSLDEDDSLESSDDDDDNNQIWESMCLHVLERLEATERKAAAYLHSACQFLLESIQLNNQSNDKRQSKQSGYSVIHNERIAFEDRVAFACTYLSPDEMYFFLQTLEEQCMAQGNIEGLVITGLNTEAGFQLLQKYVDKRSDIQTAALMVARFPNLLGPPTTSSVAGRGGNRMERQFLPEYRQLLNRWQFFIERAALDVELGRRYRHHLSRFPPSVSSTGSTSNRMGPPPSNPSRSNLQSSSDPQTTLSGDRLSYRIPPHNDSPHIYLRCHYCGTSLPVDAMMRQLHYQSSTNMRKQKPVIFCCPNCKKPLPKCYICLGSMGVINPVAEIKAAQARRTVSIPATNTSAVAAPSTPPIGLPSVPSTPGHGTIGDDDENQQNQIDSTQNFLENGRWFMWCQHCKHGGHANCIDSWFQSHLICGVNGCQCNCMIQRGS